MVALLDADPTDEADEAWLGVAVHFATPRPEPEFEPHAIFFVTHALTRRFFARRHKEGITSSLRRSLAQNDYSHQSTLLVSQHWPWLRCHRPGAEPLP